MFTRNPATGERRLFGEFLSSSQGEDVVAGIRTPDPISALASTLPSVYEQLQSACLELERRHGDVLDIEFTVERSVLYFLQMRGAKRTAEATTRIAADFVREGTIAPRQAVSMVTADQVRQVQRPGFDPAEVAAARRAGRLLTSGAGACPGQASGILVLDPDRARELAASGRPVILARPITSPADLHGMIAADGIMTATGGTTSHAAVIARALGKPCVVGCGELRIDAGARTLAVRDRTLAEGDEVCLDGTTGEIFIGAMTQATRADANADLDSLLRVAADAAGAEIFARVTLPADVELEVGVRAIDFIADEASELLQQTELIGRHPELSVPLGSPALIEAQIAGLAQAGLGAGSARAEDAGTVRAGQDVGTMCRQHSRAWLLGYGVSLFACVIFGVSQLAYRQSACPPDLRGRMNAASRWMTWSTLPAGGLLGGFLGLTIGIHASIWTAYVGSWAAGFVVYFSPLRQVRDISDLAADEISRIGPEILDCAGRSARANGERELSERAP